MAVRAGPGEEAGVDTAHRAVIDPGTLGRELEVLIDVEIYAHDRGTVEESEAAVASSEEVIAFRRLYGRRDYFVRVAVAVAVADHAARPCAPYHSSSLHWGQ